MSQSEFDEYDTKICKIIDAKHHEEVGTDDDPAYKQSIKLLLQDNDSGAVFVAPLTEEDIKELCQLDFDLHSKDMIEMAEKLRDWESDIRLLVPKKGQNITKNIILNTPSDSSIQNTSYRQASFKRFQFNKTKLKKG